MREDKEPVRYGRNVYLYFPFERQTLKAFTFTYKLNILFLPVAQLDSASDSDSEGRRFESYRVGQSTFAVLFYFFPERQTLKVY